MSAHAYPTPQENQSTASSELPMNNSPGTAEAHSAWPIVLGVFTAVLSIETANDDDDDDGFIEDNYIQANEREKAEEEEIHYFSLFFFFPKN
uniref:Uncharacterized protein n=1 Tax=Sinocyclocheilus rhinocerous TaxID=307959 RepID=A0A673GFP6_9TELE